MLEMALALEGVTKTFGKLKANDDITFYVPKGTIHGVVGENGAGKTTLMNIIYGITNKDSGTIFINSKKVKISSSKDALKYKINMVHQHFMLIDRLSVLDNIIIGQINTFSLNKYKIAARKKLIKIFKHYNFVLDLDKKVSELSVGEKQILEIIKALYRDTNLIILDEPTAVLTPIEIEHLFKVFRRLKEDGTTIIMITHKLSEIMAITDNVTVIRLGKVVKNLRTKDTTAKDIANYMVGTAISLGLHVQSRTPGAEILRLDKLTIKKKSGAIAVDNIDLVVRKKEIIGIAGVAGNGQTELLEALYGMRKFHKGKIYFEDKDISSNRRLNARKLRKIGIACVPEDRLNEGLIRDFSAKENLFMGYHYKKSYYKYGLLSDKVLSAEGHDKMNTFDIVPKNLSQNIRFFSGGNQQKVIFSREIYTSPKLMLIGQPTRGVDVRSVKFIHNKIVELRDKGVGILLISSELDEILELSDTIFVMVKGKFVGKVARKNATKTLMGRMMGGII